MTEDNYRPLGPGPRIMRPYSISQNPTIIISFTQSHRHLLSLDLQRVKFQALNRRVPDSSPSGNAPAFPVLGPPAPHAHLHVQADCHSPRRGKPRAETITWRKISANVTLNRRCILSAGHGRTPDSKSHAETMSCSFHLATHIAIIAR